MLAGPSIAATVAVAGLVAGCGIGDHLRERSIKRCLNEAGVGPVEVVVEGDSGWFNYAPSGDVDQNAVDRCFEQ